MAQIWSKQIKIIKSFSFFTTTWHTHSPHCVQKTYTNRACKHVVRPKTCLAGSWLSFACHTPVNAMLCYFWRRLSFHQNTVYDKLAQGCRSPMDQKSFLRGTGSLGNGRPSAGSRGRDINANFKYNNKVTVKSTIKLSSIEDRGQTDNIDPRPWPSIIGEQFKVEGYVVQ